MMKQTYLMAMVGAFLLAACTEKQPTSTPKTENPTNKTENATNAAKVYRVSSELNKPPMVMQGGDNTDKGFEWDLLQAIAQKQGFTIEYRPDNWNGLLQRLDRNDVDLIIGQITITDERKQKMDFSQPIISYRTGVMVLPEFADAKQFSDLKGKRISIRKNTVYEKLIPIFANANESNMVYMNTAWEQLQSLTAKKIDGMVGASTTLEYYQTKYPEHQFHIVYDNGYGTSDYGWGVKKGNTALLQDINQGLEKVRADGTYDTLYRKYWTQKPAK